MSIAAIDEPMVVTTEDNEVVITGPDGICASLTPRAARESARRLTAAVEELEGGETPQTPLG